jgi:hypothetical protein
LSIVQLKAYSERGSMAEEAARAAAFAEALREYDETYHTNSSVTTATESLPFNFATNENEATYHLSMEEQASMMLMERLSTNFDPGAAGNDQQQTVLQMNDLLMKEIMGLSGGHGTDDTTAQHLLSILEQQRQQSFVYTSTEETVERRPDKHYFTIAQDGMCRIPFNIFLLSRLTIQLICH